MTPGIMAMMGGSPASTNWQESRDDYPEELDSAHAEAPAPQQDLQGLVQQALDSLMAVAQADPELGARLRPALDIIAKVAADSGSAGNGRNGAVQPAATPIDPMAIQQMY